MDRQRLSEAARAATEIDDARNAVFGHMVGKKLQPLLKNLRVVTAPRVIHSGNTGVVIIHMSLLQPGSDEQSFV